MAVSILHSPSKQAFGRPGPRFKLVLKALSPRLETTCLVLKAIKNFLNWSRLPANQNNRSALSNENVWVWELQVWRGRRATQGCPCGYFNRRVTLQELAACRGRPNFGRAVLREKEWAVAPARAPCPSPFLVLSLRTASRPGRRHFWPG